jgi:hypothetical protein
MPFTHTDKVEILSFIKARIRIRSQTSGSGSEPEQKGPYLTGSGSATLPVTEPKPHLYKSLYGPTKIIWLVAALLLRFSPFIIIKKLAMSLTIVYILTRSLVIKFWDKFG